MLRQNQNKPLRVWLCLVFLCLFLCSVLVFGITYGRYRQDFPPVNYPFVADGAGELVLGGTVTQDWLDNGTWPPMAAGWTVSEEQASVTFSLSNGRTLQDYTRRDQTATVQLLAGLGIGAPENMTVTLQYLQEGKPVTLIGQAEKIQAGSLNHQSYGEGWIYRFFDTTGNEKTFTLTGGKLSYENLTITLKGEDPTLCRLQVFGSYTD